MTTINKMETISRHQKIMNILLKDFSSHTATSLSKELKMSRWGAWKILKKLEKDNLVIIESIGSGETSTSTIKLNWDNILTEKTLALSLT
ncbi:MAG: HTH domain-containing protein, partial [Nanoarchaeota archaeon]